MQYGPPPHLLFRCAVTVAIVLALVVYCAVLGTLASRLSIFYLGATGLLILPIAYWGRLRFRRVCLVFASVALALAVSPVDYRVRATGGPDIRLLRVVYGLPCFSGDACKQEKDVLHDGCVVPTNRPRRAILIEY